MPLEWSSIIAKSLDQAKVFVPAAGLTGLAILFAPTSWGLLTATGEIVWLPVGTIFCLVASVLMVILAHFDGIVRAISNPVRVRRNRTAVIKKLGALSKAHRAYLCYIKHKGDLEFQAWCLDETIGGLSSMGIIKAHEATGTNYYRYSVHPSVWEHIVDPTDEHRAFFNREYKDTPPWDPNRHSTFI